ncbi:hypothetical protein OG530_19195 [Streptomyces decoyicus]|uniref:hypothetical protein n=1 Tax=Streptomyces decoyicus TaxID=249567 RepID=UPI002E184AD8
MNATLAAQAVALEAAAQLARALGHLPGATVTVDRIYPGQLCVGLHNGLGDFEAWREALGIPAADVCLKEFRAGAMYLKATGKYAGAEIELTGFASVAEGDAACAPSAC